ncbi:formyltransferase family protein [Christiangramia salexigens]|nr:formyltransferase family protein [Christiangramia salexigens]
MSITLYLLNKKGFEVLKAVVENSNYKKHLSQVIYGEDNKLENDFSNEIKGLCAENGISCFSRQEGIDVKDEYSIAVGWRWLINNKTKLIVLHDSFLPFYRGFSPLVNMLINGENYVAASAIFADNEMDKGEIIYQEKKIIKYPIKILDAIHIVSALYVKLITEIFSELTLGKKLKSYPQDESLASYSIWRDSDDYFINWNEDAEKIKRFVDAVGKPYDGAKTRDSEGNVVIINDCKVREMRFEISSPGKIILLKDGQPVVVCGKDALHLVNYHEIDGKPYRIKKFRTRFL